MGNGFQYYEKQNLAFNIKGELPHYSLHGCELEILEEVKYIGSFIIQLDMKFTVHIPKKLMTLNQQLRIIKAALGFCQCQTACLQDSLLPSSRVCSSYLRPKQWERYIRHRTAPRSCSTIYSWYQGQVWCRRWLGHIALHKMMCITPKKNPTPHCLSHTLR